MSLTNFQIYARLLTYVKPFWLAFSLSILGNAIYASASVLMAKVTEYLEQAISQPSDEMRLFVCFVIVGVFAMRGLGTFLGGYFIAYVGRNVVHRIRTELFNHYLRLPCAFYDKNSSGHLVSKITFNVEQLTGAASNAITIAVREGLTVIGLFGFMIYQNWKLTAIFLLIGPVIGLVISYVSKRFRKLSQKIQASMGDVTHVASEAINGYREIKIFSGQPYEESRFNAASKNNLRQSLKMELTKSASTPVIQSLVAVSIATMLWIALSDDVRGEMTAGALIAYFVAASTIAKPIRQLTQVNATIQNGFAAAQDIFKILSLNHEDDQGKYLPQDVKGEIVFDHVNFSYESDDTPVLRDISLTIKPGQTVAFVGKSGSGKTTLVNMIPRFYQPGSGRITLDGKRIEEYALDSLRRQIALVNQQVVLFNDTVQNNISYAQGDNDATTEEIVEASKRANAQEFIENMSDGFSTMVGDNGVLLSGGQRQRIAIARALLKDAPVLILDEATSALDNESEHKIQIALDSMMEGKTTLIIAHRLSTVENADMIVVMDKGSIVEQGKHKELMAQNGVYASLYHAGFE